MSTLSEKVTGRVDAAKKRLLVEIQEDITSTHVAELRDGFHKLIESAQTEGWTHLYLDLRDCRLIDSMGVNWIFAESLRLKKLEKEFVIRISSPAINRVLLFAGLDRLVTIKFRRRKQTR